MSQKCQISIFTNQFKLLMIPLWSWDPYKKNAHPAKVNIEWGRAHFMKMFNFFENFRDQDVFNVWDLAHPIFNWVGLVFYAFFPFGSQLHRGIIKSLNWLRKKCFFGISMMLTVVFTLIFMYERTSQKCQKI